MNLLEEYFEERPKKKVNSRTKGAKNERNLCKALELWTGEEFTRVPASGGLRWINTQNICGDVICTNNDFNFPLSIETKHYKAFKLDLRREKNALLWKCWEQCKSDAERSKKVPVMFLRENGMSKNTWLVFFSCDSLCNSLFPVNTVSEGNNLISFNSVDLFNFPYKEFLKYLKIN